MIGKLVVGAAAVGAVLGFSANDDIDVSTQSVPPAHQVEHPDG